MTTLPLPNKTSAPGFPPVNHPVALELTPRARRALAETPVALVVEMELFFSCLIRKRLYFGRAPAAGAHPLPSPEARIALWFHPVMTKVCSLTTDDLEAVPLIDFPIERIAVFQPRWLALDHNSNGWQGEFGWGHRT